VLRRILQGDPGKESRFRDFEGRLPPLSAWTYLPASIASTIRFKATGTRAAIPWLGYRATRRIARIVRPGTRVLEFGSGLSTVWFARRGVEVLSVEARQEWVSQVEEWLAKIPGHKVRIVCAEPPYQSDFLADFVAGQEFDFALVDGDGRDSAMRAALSAVRPGGYLYLDNADVQEASHRAARDLALASGPSEWFVDFTPFHVFVSTGILVKKNER
jgi:hypothetical protein